MTIYTVTVDKTPASALLPVLAYELTAVDGEISHTIIWNGNRGLFFVSRRFSQTQRAQRGSAHIYVDTEIILHFANVFVQG